MGLKEIGFKLNIQDLCVANKIVDDKQHTIVWHVEDVKSSHVYPKVNDEFIQWTKENDKEKEIGISNFQRGNE